MEEKDFKFSNGSSVSDLNSFWQSLSEIDDSTFRYHVKGDKNDFAVWVKDVLNEKELAKKMVKAKTKDEVVSVVENRVRQKQIEKINAQLAKTEKKEQAQRDAALEKVKQMAAREKIDSQLAETGKQEQMPAALGNINAQLAETEKKEQVQRDAALGKINAQLAETEKKKQEQMAAALEKVKQMKAELQKKPRKKRERNNSQSTDEPDNNTETTKQKLLLKA